MNTNKYLTIIILLALLAASLPGTSVSAVGTTVVMPSDVGVNWLTADTRSGGSSAFVLGPVTPPSGVGSLQFMTTDANGSSNAKAQLFNYGYMGSNLSDLEALNYWVYRSSASTNSAAQTISLNLEVDYVGDGSTYTTLVFEPVYQSGGVGAMLADTWQLWDAYAGGTAKWWSTKNIPGVCAFDCFVPWDTILTNNPSAKIIGGFGFNVGSGWVGNYEGATDSLIIGFSGSSTTYDFEPDIEGPTTSNVLASPNPIAIDGSVVLTANVDDSLTGGSNIVSAEYSLDGGSWTLMSATDAGFDDVSEDVTVNFTAPALAEIYDLCVRGTDSAGLIGAEECILLVVYDPSGGFVTGGGWIDSPPGSANPLPTVVWDQGFEADTAGWFNADDAWYGMVTRVASGTGGIASSSGSYHAVIQGDTDSGPFSRFDGYRSTWPGTWTAEVDIYLDPAWASGTGFDYSVAATGSDGAHQRDYIFHVTKDTSTGKLLVAGSNNTNFAPREDLENINHYEVTSAGWYTFQHVFRDQGGALAVDLNLLDASENVLFTETRSTAADTIPGEVGGNRYAWFTFINVGGGIAVDEHQLILQVSPTGKANFGFVSKYKKGASLPTGSAEFVFEAGDLNFHSNVQDWLIVTGSDYARFKGSGTINGALAPNGDPYKFMIWAGDGTGSSGADTFRIRIWYEVDGTEIVVYDNGTDQAIGGGSIVVHTK